MGFQVGTSGADFRSRMKLRSERVKEQVRVKIAAYGVKLIQELSLATPILTGQAKANWRAALGSPDGTMIGPGGVTSDPRQLAHGPPQTVDYGMWNGISIITAEQFRIGQTLYIFNNLPYIEKLNNTGFVQAAIMTASASIKR